MHRPPRTLRLALLTTLVLAGAACSPAADPKDEKATNSTIPSFVYGVEAVAGTLDVAGNYNSADMAIMGLVTEPLEIPNLDGSFTPVLAESVDEPDTTTTVYHLKQDVTFSDGSPLTSADVVWTIDHLRGDTTQTGSEFTDIADVVATDENTVTVTYSRPNNAARGSLALVSFIQQDEYAAAQGDKFGTSDAPPIGTGPYVIDSYTSSEITLERNPGYAGDKPAPDAIKVVPIKDDTTAQLAMRSGEVDSFALLDVKTSKTWKSVPGAQLYSSPTLYLDYVAMDTSEAPFSDVHVRRAVAYATDVKGLLEANYGDQAQPAKALTPTQIIDRMAPDGAAADDLAAGLGAFTLDLDQARAELAKSAYPDGFTAEYEYYSPPGKLVGLSLAQNLKEIGITLKLKSRRLNDYIGDLFVGKVPAIGFTSIAAIVPDPSSWYLYLIGKDNPYNAARYSTPETEQALKVIDASDDAAARWDAMRTVVSTMAEGVPYVQLAQPDFVLAVADGATFVTEPDFIQMTSGAWVHALKSTE